MKHEYLHEIQIQQRERRINWSLKQISQFSFIENDRVLETE